MHTRILLLLTVVVLALMAACSGNTKDNTPNDPAPAGQEAPSAEEPSTEEPSDPAAEEPAQGSNEQPAGNDEGTQPDLFESGVFIDWNSVEDPLLDDKLKATLQAFLTAVTKPDEAGYERLFPNHATEDHADFRDVLEKPMNYRFEEVGKAIEEAGRILVPVSGTSRDDVFGVREFSNNLYFKQNEQNEWEVILID
ncbi:hypothetical protein OIN60_17345 [Paenibacillus sp. P96]|uniref:Lipoprotein n=1 Tax=Paenibacillus zeirhizosphaerae TaxID=2987519 RepID=A0ABT9FVK5_9BACL|nr:hypothetical protein [Paenibacillus sp. P96]MDP4098502.1 hypothetical protein [Paenibacillus sp. P96]